MDVTSLLNSSSLGKGETAINIDAREMVNNVINAASTTTEGVTRCLSTSCNSSHEKTSSRRTSETKVPSRNRTPWDANGYALPLTVDTKSTQPPDRPVSNSTSPAESGSPKSPRHKFSDSHSSLSSYASSSTSLSHSRISSMSTVGGNQPNSTTSDPPSLGTQVECAELPIPKIWSSDIHQRETKGGIMSLSAVNGEALVTGLVRSSSPSDAMLISRGTQSLSRMNRQDAISAKEIRPDPDHLAPLDFTKAHKRAISAPDFAATDSVDRSFPTLPTTFHSTSSPLYRDEARLSCTMAATSPPPALIGQPSQDEGIVCMYKPNCDTGSQLRKAISHIFGRNKTCTRNIPSHVWVHFCRKHYQRSRYRNAQEWARVQCDLVQKQIRRVQDWSDENKRTGQPGIVQEWSLSMRKREQNRVQEKTNRKRSYRDESEDDDDIVPDSATLNGTAVPDWLRSKCGDGYSTAEIEEIVARLKQEMEETNMTQIPDIEILPNISMDASNDTRPKTLLKRKTSTGSYIHKRSQSVGVALRPESHPMTRRVSQPAYWRQEDIMRPSPVEKRQRISDTPSYNERHGRTHSIIPERPAIAPLRDMYTLPHRPAFNNIQESRAEDSYYNHEDTKVPNYSYDRWSASTSQRSGAQQGAPTLESSAPRNYLGDRRSSHQRSFSEVDSFQHNFTFRSPLDYPSMPPNHFPESAPYERSPMPSGHSHPSPASSGYYDDHQAAAQRSLRPYQSSWPSPASGHAPSYSGYRHMRHQSTPSAPNTGVPQIPTAEYGHANGPRPYEQSPPYHRRQRSYAPSRQYSHRPLVQETDQAKAVFSERR
ncbi:hypothetical protein F4776DRAFT_661069 [Hypoxylon sp. NC0597]|nr:hypothetical protein F4776DRAFT_661069 [Hypoxylon sp. NC0597]